MVKRTVLQKQRVAVVVTGIHNNAVLISNHKNTVQMDRFRVVAHACSHVFVSAFVLYDIAEMKQQGKTDEAKELSDRLIQDGRTHEEVEEGVRQMQKW